MSRAQKIRRALIAAVVIGGVLAVALWPTPVPVEVATISRGPLVVSIDEEGQTRVRDRFVVSAPVTGRVQRIALEPGDRVKRGDVVARIRPEAPALIDVRTRAEIEAAVRATGAALERARAEQQRARAALTLAQQQLARTRQLVEAGADTQRELEAREADVKLAEETLAASASGVKAAEAEVERAKARLAPSRPDAGAAIVTVTAPADGVVLRRLRESESLVPAGEPLLEIGDPGRLEIVADLLSTDAVRVKPGARAMIEQWGDEAVLEATVRRIEPAGFTKVSALGVEEQRVNVILDFVDAVKAGAVLGDAYRVEVRIVVWESQSVVKVPTGALFREGDQWSVYTASDGRAQRVAVELGRQTGQEAEVLSGLSEGTRVILHPGDQVADGVPIEERAAPET
jgi:HlyD family secretion protein